MWPKPAVFTVTVKVAQVEFPVWHRAYRATAGALRRLRLSWEPLKFTVTAERVADAGNIITGATAAGYGNTLGLPHGQNRTAVAQTNYTGAVACPAAHGYSHYPANRSITALAKVTLDVPALSPVT